MSQVLAVYGLLLLVSFIGGYAPARWLARDIPSGQRLALMPLLGVSCIALTLLWVNLFTPLRGAAVFAGLAPVALGLVTAAIDVRRRRPRMPRLPILMWAATMAAGSACVLAPFLLLGSATSFGIANNDAFWYTQADWRVQVASYLARPEQIPSTLARYPALIQRYGLDYLSVLIQSITGLRSWQVVHLTGALGILLVMLSCAMLARRARVWWPFAILAGVAGGANAFMYRLYLDAFLAFGYGLAFLLGICWLLASPAVTGKSNRHVLVLALLFAGSAVFYMDILPIVAVISLVFILLAQKPSANRLGMFSFAIVAAGIMAAPMAVTMPQHLQAVASAAGSGVFFSFPDRLADACYFLGMFSLYDMLGGVRAGPLPLLGGAAVLLLALHAVWRIRRQGVRSNPALYYFVPLAFLVAYLLFAKKAEYSAHRVYAMMAAVAPILLLGDFGRSRRRSPKFLTATLAILLLVAAGAALLPERRLLNAVVRSDIHVTNYEKEIGETWIPSLPKDSRILIDAGDDNRLIAPHYMYWETLYGTGENEARVIFPRHRYAYITPAPPLEDLDLARCGYVLRRRKLHQIEGDLRVVRNNPRYELLAVSIMDYFGQGFYGPEDDHPQESHWMSQDGQLVIVSREPGLAEFDAAVSANPVLHDEKVTFRLNATPIGGEAPADGSSVRLVLPLNAGRNTLLVHSSLPPAPPGAVDRRPLSARFTNVNIHRLALQPRPAVAQR